MISSLASKGQDLVAFNFTCYFEVSKDFMTKFKTQALHTTKFQYQKTSRNGNSPSLIPALLKIAIYVLKMKFSLLFNI